MRAAMLPMPGDPFLLTAFIKNFEAVWASEVDTLYICLNMDHRLPQEIRDYNIAFLSEIPKVKFMVVDQMLFQGAALRELLKMVEEDLVMSIEDDTVIIKQGQVDRCFRKIEMGEADVVGSPRFSCGNLILDASAKKYDLDYSGYGDKGPNLWPNFFFARKSDLLKTDLHFEPKSWEAGETIPYLDVVAEQTEAADVFVWLCIQLRGMGLRFSEVPQYHSHPNDLQDMIHGKNLWDGTCPWVHIGSLTMTIEDFILYSSPAVGHKNTPHTDMEKKELERRFAWVYLFVEKVSNERLKFLEAPYIKVMNEFVKVFGLSVRSIDRLKSAYKGLLRW